MKNGNFERDLRAIAMPKEFYLGQDSGEVVPTVTKTHLQISTLTSKDQTLEYSMLHSSALGAKTVVCGLAGLLYTRFLKFHMPTLNTSFDKRRSEHFPFYWDTIISWGDTERSFTIYHMLTQPSLRA
jgi:hypothetical protein